MTTIQARLSHDEFRRLEADQQELGLNSRSDALRKALELLHKEARQAALSRSYEQFYGPGENVVPLSETAKVGHHIWADQSADDERLKH